MKKKVKVKFKVILIILIILILGFSYYWFFIKDNNTTSSSQSSQTSKEESNIIIDKSKELNVYNEEYLNEYKNIVYVDTQDFIVNINSLLDKGYSAEEINAIYENLEKEDIDKLMNQEYLNLVDFFSISNFEIDNYNRYISTSSTSTMELPDVVTYVNIGLDQPFYSVYEEVTNYNDITVIVNKYHKLPDNYAPTDLVSLSYSSSYKMRKEAADAFELMVADASSVGLSIIPYSAYRSFTRQTELYTSYVSRDGKELADTYSARPGFSEHQTGLAVDVRSPEYSNKLNDTTYAWLETNAHNYGYFIRYPQGKTSITGYVYEDWHIRYIGKEHATKLKELNITYDEYYDLYIK